jgi:trimeric autotransporter adhesin
MPALSHATRGTSKVGAILASLFLVAMLLPGAVLAATLTFSTQPAGATGGVPFTTQPKVTLADATTGTVSLAIAAGSPSGTLSGCAAPDSTTGTFTFSGCQIDKAGTGYKLVATWSVNPAVTATSAAFDVAVGAAAKLAFTQAAIAGAAVGANLAPQPVVTIQDLGGNTVTSSTAAVALAIKTGTPTTGGPGALACTADSVAAILGVATFANCRINTNSGLGYVLRATSGSLAAADSNAFNITSGTATKLAFSAQPGGGTGGTGWTNQPAVQVQDASGNRGVTDDTTIVTLAIGTNPGAGTLTCTGGLSKTVASGQATFAGCTITKVGTGYTLVATSSPVLTAATSTAFNVTLGPAAKLGFTAQPGASTSNAAFAIQPVVAVQDAGGNTVTSGTNSTATVTLAIGTNPAGGTLTCTGGLSTNAVAGVATFSGCQINNAGVGYTLTAIASGLTGATSTAFTVGQPAASITLTTSAPIGAGGLPTITWGGGIILTTQFGANGGNKTFKLQATRDNVTWFDIGPLLTTNTAGRSVFAFRPSTNFFYRAVFAGTADLAAGTSASVRTVVRQIALLRPTNGGAVRSISRNTSITFFTVVRPSRPELTPARVTFSFFRLSGSTWVLSTQRTVTAAADGRAATTFKFSTSGQWYVRSMANPTTYNANSVMSTIERYSVN